MSSSASGMHHNMYEIEYSNAQIYRNPSVIMRRQRYEDSTSNLGRHVESCNPSQRPAAEMISAYANGTTYSASRFRYLLAMWCARRHRPFLIVQDDELQEIFRMLYSRVDIPSRFTISRDVREMFELSKANVIKVLTVCYSFSLLFSRADQSLGIQRKIAFRS